MNRFSVYLLLLAIGVQSVTLHSQRAFVADPIELAHVKLIDDAELDKNSHRFSFDLAVEHCRSAIIFDRLRAQTLAWSISFCYVHHADAQSQRGPPSLLV